MPYYPSIGQATLGPGDVQILHGKLVKLGYGPPVTTATPEGFTQMIRLFQSNANIPTTALLDPKTVEEINRAMPDVAPVDTSFLTRGLLATLGDVLAATTRFVPEMAPIVRQEVANLARGLGMNPANLVPVAVRLRLAGRAPGAEAAALAANQLSAIIEAVPVPGQASTSAQKEQLQLLQQILVNQQAEANRLRGRPEGIAADLAVAKTQQAIAELQAAQTRPVPGGGGISTTTTNVSTTASPGGGGAKGDVGEAPPSTLQKIGTVLLLTAPAWGTFLWTRYAKT